MMRGFGRAAIASMAFAVAAKGAIAQDSDGWILALSKTDHTLAMVDPESLKVIARIPVGPDPHEVVPTPDGSVAFVSINGNGKLHEIDEIDLVHHTAIAKIDTALLLGPHGLAFAGGKLYFTAEGAKSVARYDPQSHRIDWQMGTGQNRTHMIHVTPDEKTIFVTNVDLGTVSILRNELVPPPVTPMGYVMPGMKGSMDWVETVIPLFDGIEGFDISPDGTRLWTASPRNGQVFILDTTTRRLEETVDAGAFGANRIRFTPDGKRVLITSLQTGDLFVFDSASRKLIKKINVGTGAAGVLISPDGARAFIGCTLDNYVAVVDLKTYTVTSHIDVGGRPDGLAWATR